MTDDDTTTGSFALEEWPDPVCRFRDDDGAPVVEAVNGPFETTFGLIPSGKPVTTVFGASGLSIVRGPDDSPGIGTADDRMIVETGTGASEAGTDNRYLLRVVSADGDSGGVLLFTPIPAGVARETGEIGLDHVASVISHDLRNPLDVAKARLRAARDTGEAEHFEHVADAHNRMERIIEDVLTLASGSDVVQPDERVALSDAAEQAWKTVETDDAELVIEDTLPTVVADPDRLRRLFENLFRNAVEHGGSDVTVTVGALGDDSGFYVADDGRGIQPERRERVFDPGFSSDEHGTGIGLSIVARIVDLHGWSIAVTDSASGGACFEITDLEKMS
ncbi:MAG: sensor histidine kinase [Halorhabdus sp.]